MWRTEEYKVHISQYGRIGARHPPGTLMADVSRVFRRRENNNRVFLRRKIPTLASLNIHALKHEINQIAHCMPLTLLGKFLHLVARSISHYSSFTLDCLWAGLLASFPPHHRPILSVHFHHAPQRNGLLAINASPYKPYANLLFCKVRFEKRNTENWEWVSADATGRYEVNQ